MMKKTTILTAVVSAAALVQAAVFDVRDYGARGDGVAKDTEAIQKAIDAATAVGGGTVELGAGTYLSGTIWLRDNVDFHLGPGAVLLASPDRADYNAADAFPQNWASAPSGDNTSGGHLVVGVGVKDVTLRGPGKIDGNSRAFLVDPKTGTNWDGWKKGIPWRPGQMIEIVDSSDVRVTDLEIADSPYWSCYLLNCTRVWIRGCYLHDVRRPWKTWNGDGFDLDRCQHVTLSDCRIDTEDDGITLRASSAKRLKAPQDCAYVTIANCSISSSCNGIRFGVGEGRIHDVVVDNVVFSDTRTALNFVGAYGKGSRGTDITDVRVSNVRAEAGILLMMYHRFAAEALFGNIVFDGISAKTSEPTRLAAAAMRPFEGIVFRNVDSPAGISVVNAEARIEGGDLPRVAPDLEQVLKLTPHVFAPICRAVEYETLNPHFAKAFAFLRRTDLATLKVGRYEIDGDDCWAMVQEANLTPFDEKAKAEVHRRYVDIQAPITGEETIGVATLDGAELEMPFADGSDVRFPAVRTVPRTVRPGEFAIFFPAAGAHAPGHASGAERTIRKVVIKVRQDELEKTER